MVVITKALWSKLVIKINSWCWWSSVYFLKSITLDPDSIEYHVKCTWWDSSTILTLKCWFPVFTKFVCRIKEYLKCQIWKIKDHVNWSSHIKKTSIFHKSMQEYHNTEALHSKQPIRTCELERIYFLIHSEYRFGNKFRGTLVNHSMGNLKWHGKCQSSRLHAD